MLLISIVSSIFFYGFDAILGSESSSDCEGVNIT